MNNITILKGHVPFGPIHGVTSISLHAMDRAAERYNVVGTFAKRRCWAENRFSQAVEIALPDRAKVAKLLDHRFQDARYFSFAKVGREKSIIFVVEGKTIKTIHSGAAKEFQQAKPIESVAATPARVITDTERMTWLEANLLHMQHSRFNGSVDMGGICIYGQLHRPSHSGPTKFVLRHRSIRQALDEAIQSSADG